MDKISIKSSRIKPLVVLLGCAGFVAGGIFVLKTDGPALVAWSSICFFGAGIPIMIFQIIDRRPRLIIDNDGIIDRTLGIGKVPWKEINNAYLRSLNGNNFICLELADSDKYLLKLSKIKRGMVNANQRLGFTPFSINLVNVDIDSNQALELILKKSAEAKSR